MSNKTKAKIAVVVVALVALGYFFVNTTAEIDAMFRKIGIAAVIVLILGFAIGAFVLINKYQGKKSKKEAVKQIVPETDPIEIEQKEE